MLHVSPVLGFVQPIDSIHLPLISYKNPFFQENFPPESIMKKLKSVSPGEIIPDFLRIVRPPPLLPPHTRFSRIAPGF